MPNAVKLGPALMHSFGGVSAAALLFTAATAASQNLFVSCYGNNSIVEVAPDGTVSTFASGLDVPAGLAFDGAGDLFEADEGTGNIYEFANVNGTLSSSPTVFASGLDMPFGLVFNTVTGDLFVSEYGNGDIAEITSGGTSGIFATGMDGPEGLAILQGYLFVANEAGNTVSEISPSGSVARTLTGFSNPSGVAFNVITLAVANQGNGVIDRVITPLDKNVIASGLNDPNGLAFDNNDLNLYEADTGSGKINEFIPTTESLGPGSVGVVVYTETNFVSGLDEPVELAFQPVIVPEPTRFGLLAAAGSIIVYLKRKKYA